MQQLYCLELQIIKQDSWILPDLVLDKTIKEHQNCAQCCTSVILSMKETEAGGSPKVEANLDYMRSSETGYKVSLSEKTKEALVSKPFSTKFILCQPSRARRLGTQLRQ